MAANETSPADNNSNSKSNESGVLGLSAIKVGLFAAVGFVLLVVAVIVCIIVCRRCRRNKKRTQPPSQKTLERNHVIKDMTDVYGYKTTITEEEKEKSDDVEKNNKDAEGTRYTPEPTQDIGNTDTEYATIPDDKVNPQQNPPSILQSVTKTAVMEEKKNPSPGNHQNTQVTGVSEINWHPLFQQRKDQVDKSCKTMEKPKKLERETSEEKNPSTPCSGSSPGNVNSGFTGSSSTNCSEFISKQTSVENNSINSEERIRKQSQTSASVINSSGGLTDNPLFNMCKESVDEHCKTIKPNKAGDKKESEEKGPPPPCSVSSPAYVNIDGKNHKEFISRQTSAENNSINNEESSNVALPKQSQTSAGVTNQNRQATTDGSKQGGLRSPGGLTESALFNKRKESVDEHCKTIKLNKGGDKNAAEERAPPTPCPGSSPGYENDRLCSSQNQIQFSFGSNMNIEVPAPCHTTPHYVNEHMQQ